MAGIYIHIPFCKQACTYCDFHFSTSMKNKEDMVKAIASELELQRNYPEGEKIETIYFGGGTPSLLSASELDHIFAAVHKYYSVDLNAEVTLEANPDDLTKEKLKSLRELSVNRLSIGVQSFREEDLQFMNRAHNSKEAESSVKRAQDAGIENISIDLIYGVPGMSEKDWSENLVHAVSLDVKHLSCYALTVENKTVLSHNVLKGITKMPEDETTVNQFNHMAEYLTGKGFEHYEISNFCKPGYISKHNSSYWKRTKFLGIGPSAHSFNGHSRSWNISNNTLYLNAIGSGTIPRQTEELSAEKQYNEYIMTSLRAMWGCDTKLLLTEFGSERKEEFISKATNFVSSGTMDVNENFYRLTNKGKIISDHIISELFAD